MTAGIMPPMRDQREEGGYAKLANLNVRARCRNLPTIRAYNNTLTYSVLRVLPRQFA